MNSCSLTGYSQVNLSYKYWQYSTEYRCCARDKSIIYWFLKENVRVFRAFQVYDAPRTITFILRSAKTKIFYPCNHNRVVNIRIQSCLQVEHYWLNNKKDTAMHNHLNNVLLSNAFLRELLFIYYIIWILTHSVSRYIFCLTDVHSDRIYQWYTMW